MEKCLCCGAEGGGYLCERCGVILPPGEVDYFALFSLPRRFGIDEGILKEKYFALSRLFHPDAHVQDPPEIQEAALRWSALLNNAYQTLKDQAKRFRYLLSLEIGWDQEGAGQLSIAHFELMERLQGALDLKDEAEKAGRLENIRAEVQAEQEGIERNLEELTARFDALEDRDGGAKEAILEAIKAKLQEHSYTKRMLTLIDEPEMVSRFHW